MIPRKVCVVVTARPSYSRIKTALRAMSDHPALELQLVVAASALLDRYGNAARYIEQDGFPIAARVYMVLEGENLVTSAKSTGLGLVELATVFDNLRPDVVVTIADRYETLATAVAASYMNIPVAHVQGGEVTGSIDEKVRHAVAQRREALPVERPELERAGVVKIVQQALAPTGRYTTVQEFARAIESVYAAPPPERRPYPLRMYVLMGMLGTLLGAVLCAAVFLLLRLWLSS